MTDKSSGQTSGTPTTTDDSKSPAKKKPVKGKKTASLAGTKLTSPTMERLDKQTEELNEKRKQEAARLRKKYNREKAVLKKKERTLRNGQNIAIGVVYEIEGEKEPKVYDETTRLLDKHLTERHVRKRFEGRIPPRHRSDKGDDTPPNNTSKKATKEFKATA